jgi:hypothetical protein
MARSRGLGDVYKRQPLLRFASSDVFNAWQGEQIARKFDASSVPPEDFGVM